MKHDLKGQKVGQWTSDEVHFAVLAIESAAKKMDISPMEMQRRLKKQDLLESYIIKCYDVFHTMSLDHVAEDTVDALLNWEHSSQAMGGDV